MHTHAVTIRSDLDLLDHVTNVAYTELASDALAVMMREGLMPRGRGIVTMAVDYLEPVGQDHREVRVLSTMSGDRVDQRIVAPLAGSDRLAAVQVRLGQRGRLCLGAARASQ